MAEAYVRAEIPHVRAVPSEATYLVWLDCTELPVDASEAARRIRELSLIHI